MQVQIDFNANFTHPHNNRESELHFDQNIDHFSEQCKLVYSLMKQGHKLTTLTALRDHGIGDLRRRVKDLIDVYHIPVQSEWVPKQNGKNGHKQYYL